MARHFTNVIAIKNPVYAPAQFAKLNFYGSAFIWRIVALPIFNVRKVRGTRLYFAIDVFTFVIKVLAWDHCHFTLQSIRSAVADILGMRRDRFGPIHQGHC
jgi:hypothetical protein